MAKKKPAKAEKEKPFDYQEHRRLWIQKLDDHYFNLADRVVAAIKGLEDVLAEAHKRKDMHVFIDRYENEVPLRFNYKISRVTDSTTNIPSGLVKEQKKPVHVAA